MSEYEMLDEKFNQLVKDQNKLIYQHSLNISSVTDSSFITNEEQVEMIDLFSDSYTIRTTKNFMLINKLDRELSKLNNN